MLSTRDAVRFLFKWKGTLVGFFLFVVLSTMSLAYLLPMQYAAEALVLIERNRAPVMRTDFAPGLEMVEAMNTASEIVRSRPVMEAVVEELKPHEAPKNDTWLRRTITAARNWLERTGLANPSTPRERWIRGLLDDVRAKPQPNSNILEIAYYTDTPVLGAAIVNSVTNHYIRRHLEIYGNTGRSEIFRAEMERSGQELDRLRRLLEEEKARRSIAATSQIKRELVSERGRLRDRQGQAEAEVVDLLLRFQGGHPAVTAARERSASIAKRIADLEERVMALEREEDVIRNIELLISSQEEAFIESKERYEESLVSEHATRDTLNVRIVAPAEVPPVPAYSRLLILVGAVAGGAILAFLIALIREYFDNSIRDPQSVESILGVPVVGSIPVAGLLSGWRPR